MNLPFSTTITRKIGLKVTGLVFLCASLFLSLVGFLLYQYITGQITERMAHRLTLSNERVSSRIISIVHEKEKIGLLFNHNLRARLDSTSFFYENNKYKIQADGAIRSLQVNGESGAFVPAGVKLDRESRQFLSGSQHYFRKVMPFVRLFFMDIFYTTNKSVFRLSPPGEWVKEVEADYNAENYPFYYLADAEHNPERKPVWTPIYYDSHIGSWMTSLIVPDYRGDLLLGVSGNDYALDQIFHEFITMASLAGDTTTVLFSAKGHIILHPDYLQEITRLVKKTSTLQSISPTIAPELEPFLQEYLSKQPSHFVGSFSFENNKQLAVAMSLGFLDWQVLSYISKDKMSGLQNRVFGYIAAMVVFSVLLISTLISLGIRHLILKRIFTLKDKAESYILEQAISFTVPGEDEISQLSWAFSKMAKQLDKKYRMEKMLADITGSFNTVSTENIDLLINDGLKGIGELSGADRAYYFIYSNNYQRMHNTHEWVRAGIPPEKEFYQNFEASGMGWLNKQLLQNKVVSIADVSQLPEEAEQAKYYMQNASGPEGAIRSLIAHPVFQKEKLYGVIGFDSVATLTDWGEIDTRLFGMIGQVFAEGQMRLAREQKIHRTEKMEAVGLMAGGVAHDLNNILSGIVSYPEILLIQLDDNDPMRKPLEIIRQAGLRAAKVVDDLLTVARGVAAIREIANLNSLVDDYLESPEGCDLQSFYKDHNFTTEFTQNLPNISCSSIHIKKCIMNLVTNAAEAQKHDGEIILSTHFEIVNTPITGHLPVEPGQYTVLTVSDCGPGIKEKDLQHIFEPFYTKKVMGKSGTGLGLAVVWNTMRDHFGGIIVESDDKGTSFSLYFPASGDMIADTQESEQEVLGRGEHILVVDDEPELRDIACQLLEKLGYRANSVSSGEEAIEYVRTQSVDIILLDMLMEPGINGRQTYEEIVKIYPEQPALIASGFSVDSEVRKTLELGAYQFIKKPYTSAQLGLAIREALNNRPSGSMT